MILFADEANGWTMYYYDNDMFLCCWVSLSHGENYGVENSYIDPTKRMQWVRDILKSRPSTQILYDTGDL